MDQGSGVAVSCGVALRRGSDPMLLWLWRRLVAIAPIRPLAWEPPHATGAALEKAKRKRNWNLKCIKYITYIRTTRVIFAKAKSGTINLSDFK